MAFPAEASALDFVMPILKGRQDRRGRALPGKPDKVSAGQLRGALQPGQLVQRAGPVRRGHPARCRALRIGLASATSGAHPAHGPKRRAQASWLAASCLIRSGDDFCCGLLGRRPNLRRWFKVDRRH